MNANEPNCHADHKTLMAHYKSLAQHLAQRDYNTTLAPIKNGWELNIYSPEDKHITVSPRDILEATRILFAVASLAKSH